MPPPSRLWLEGAVWQSQVGATGGCLGAPPDQATGHMGAGSWAHERGDWPWQVWALVRPGRAPGAGSQVTAPRGAGGGRPAVWAGLPAFGATGSI